MTDRRFRKATYPMSIEDKDELAQEFAEFGYRETFDPNDADRRNFYKVNRGPRGRYTLRQGIRVLERWPPHAPR